MRTILLTVVALAALPVASASAATLEIHGNTKTFTYTAASGEANELTIAQKGTSWAISDPGALPLNLKIDGGGQCTVATNVATCDNIPTGYAFRVLAGDRDDMVSIDADVPFRVEGGEGNDVLLGGSGADRLLGDKGNDRLAGGAGADRIEGGDGTDVVDYGSSLLAVRVTPDGSPGDGPLGEGDDVETDVEGSVGGAGSDDLTAGEGGGSLDGGAGDDILRGGPGTDVFLGGDGNDKIFSADSAAESISCGDGTDVVVADAFDTVATNCENGTAAAPAPAVKTSDKGRGTSTRGSGDDDDESGTSAKPLAAVGSDDAPKTLDVDQIAPVVEPGVALPQRGRRVSVAPAAGVVIVTPPGEKPERLSDGASLPVGAVVDTTRGAVTLTSAASAAGGLQTARFQGARFRVTQGKGANAVTELALTGPAPKCAPRPHAGRAIAAARRKPAVRRLWGSGHGRFRTKGRYAAATVRGTIWMTEDRCGGTLVQVKRGLVAVRDNVRRRTVDVAAGKHYLARAR